MNDDRERISSERDWWKARYEQQHKTLHAMEDTIADLRKALGRIVANDGQDYTPWEAVLAYERALQIAHEALHE